MTTYGNRKTFRETKLRSEIGWASVPELVVALGTDVPAEIASMADWPAQRRIDEAQRWVPAIAMWGDNLQYEGKRPGAAYRGLVIGLACASYATGGISFAGLRWESGPDNQHEEVA